MSGRRGGGISKNRRGPVRTDRDGDATMGGSIPTGPRKTRSGPISAATTKQPVMKGKRKPVGNKNPAKDLRRTARTPVGGFIELKISGWKPSNLDPIQTAVFLEGKIGIKFHRCRTVGENIVAQVPISKVTALLELDNVRYQNVNLKIVPASDLPEGLKPKGKPEISAEAQQLSADLLTFLTSRYNATSKLLNLSNLGNDEFLKSKGLFQNTSTTEKMFPALMHIADDQFGTHEAKREAVAFVSLEGNTLSDLSAISSLATTFPDLKGLSLRSNNIATFQNMSALKFKFKKLEELILLENPITGLESYQKTIRQWYKELKMLDNVVLPPIPKGPRELPPLILPVPNGFGAVDEPDATNTFLGSFFQMYDKDRKACLDTFYTADSLFSISINTSAPRVQGGTPAIQKWDAYIPESRNLKKVHGAGPIQKRLAKGKDKISDIWTKLPTTLHDVQDAGKWCFDSRLITTPEGLSCLILTVHGEFEEPENFAKTEVASKRSFSRVISVFPKIVDGVPNGFIVGKDMLSIRAWGGSEAWKKNEDGTVPQQPQQPVAAVPVPVVAQGPVPVDIAGLSEIQVQMLVQLMKQTGLVEGWARKCLEQTGWVWETALQAFETVKASGALPADAIVPVL